MGWKMERARVQKRRVPNQSSSPTTSHLYHSLRRWFIKAWVKVYKILDMLWKIYVNVHFLEAPKEVPLFEIYMHEFYTSSYLDLAPNNCKIRIFIIVLLIL